MSSSESKGNVRLASASLPHLTALQIELTNSRSQNRETPALAEEYHSLAWSIDCSSFPFVPILAVAGEAAVINIYRNESSEIMAPSFVFDRSITGHGRVSRLTLPCGGFVADQLRMSRESII